MFSFLIVAFFLHHLHVIENVSVFVKGFDVVWGRMRSATFGTNEVFSLLQHCTDARFTQGVKAGKHPGCVLPTLGILFETHHTFRQLSAMLTPEKGSSFLKGHANIYMFFHKTRTYVSDKMEENPLIVFLMQTSLVSVNAAV